MVELDVDIWLRPEDIEDETEIEFTDEGEEVLINLPNGDAKKVFEIGVLLPNGQKRKWTMNLTSQRAVATKYGTDTKNWVGKKAVIYKVQQNVRGELRDVIYART